MSTRRTLVQLALALPWAGWTRAQGGGVVVIGHPGLERLDLATLQRIFTGRVVEVGGISVNPVNVSQGDPVRSRFLATFLNQDEEKYLAYWTVRRYIGKGVPPREFATASEVIRFVQSTPGAIGYVDESSVPAGANVLVR